MKRKFKNVMLGKMQKKAPAGRGGGEGLWVWRYGKVDVIIQSLSAPALAKTWGHRA